MDFSIISENLKLLKDTNVLIDVETVKGKAESHDSVQYVMQLTCNTSLNDSSIVHLLCSIHFVLFT